MWRFRGLVLGALALVVLLSAPARVLGQGRVLVIGDSLMAIHSISGNSVADRVQALLGRRVVDRSVLGARMIYKLPISGAMGLSIPAQFRGASWNWVVMNGGGNDLWLGCGCTKCARKLDRLIASDGTRGAIPKLFARIQKTGAQVVYVGYLRSPGIDTPIEHCKAAGDELEARVARLAARIDGLHYLSNQDLVPPRDTSFFGVDGIHPSIKGSRAIAARVADFLRAQR